MKAMDLKQRMGALKGEEKERYEQQFVPKLLKPEDVDSIKVEAEEKSAEPQTKSGEQEIESILKSWMRWRVSRIRFPKVFAIFSEAARWKRQKTAWLLL